MLAFHRAWLVLLGTCLLCVASIVYSAKHLGIDTDTEDMLSKDLPFRVAYARYKRAFPAEIDTVLIIIEANIPEFADRATQKLSEHLEKEALFKTVYVPGGGQFFEDNGLLYLDIAELEELTDNLAKAQPLLSRLSQDYSLRGLLSVLGEALDTPVEGLDLALKNLLSRLQDAVQAILSDQDYQMSWQELIRGDDASQDVVRRFIVAQPHLDYTELLPGQQALLTIRQLTNKLFEDSIDTIRVRMTGDVALTYEEMEGVSRGARMATVVSLIGVFLTLFMALRSLRLVFATMVALLIGLLLTVGFATLAVGHLNLISMAFAVLYIGLGVDYAIHFNLRYSDRVRCGDTQAEALRECARDIGPALVLCGISTAVGFFAFVPTDYKGVSELGLISGTGMILSLVVTLTVLPAVIKLLPGGGLNSTIKISNIANLGRGMHFPTRFSRPIRYLTIPLILGTLLILREIKFDSNPMNLRNPKAESVSAFHDLLASSDSSPMTITALVQDDAKARKYADELSQKNSVDKAVTIFDYVPTDQEEKLSLIEEIDLVLGPNVGHVFAFTKVSADEQILAVKTLLLQLDAYIKENAFVNEKNGLYTSIVQLRSSLNEFLSTLESDTGVDYKNSIVSRLQSGLLDSFPIALRSLRNAVNARQINLAGLPLQLRERWIGKDDTYRVEVFPRENISNNSALQNFVSEVQEVKTDATGAPVIMLEAGTVVVGAFRQAFIGALIVIILILIMKFRSIADPLFVILPLVFAGLLTVAAMVLLELPFNFANIIALPLLFGLGVDNGIHMVHAVHKAIPQNQAILGTSTARGVFFSGLTTVFSFGSLVFMPHVGMSSMGKVLAIGVLLSIVCTLVVLPAFLLRFRKLE